ncbi:Endonuclease III [Candidatus Kinetoplastibacterium sorsogonicusi]|uniref:Endonuclease III n=1 Tax=Candidatus Kinetoplastidibacterium kentomonadis TaxID=1576550 RepID=A0A3S7JA89_9PROT|nr:endonuclease III [Candidatus Kinetoplastibacterium sorsogonicusi]AWD32571.1 Endonuclease III [Candidatus Kinetoplastibacterium sorsogonicusi]
MNKNIYNIFYILNHIFNNTKIRLNYTNQFQLLIAVILSAKTNDEIVNQATSKFFNYHKSPESIINLGEEKLKIYIKNVGLYNIKSKNIIKLCQILITNFNSNIPNNFNDLIKLPGVGRKTANLILNEVFGYSTIAVDSHVFRVSRRIGISDSDKLIEVEKDLINNVPKQFLKNAHNVLLNFGRNICKAKTPQCISCPIKKFCKHKL